MRTATALNVAGVLLLGSQPAWAGTQVTCAEVKAAMHMQGLGASSSADELAGKLNTTTERVRECQEEIKAGFVGGSVPAPAKAEGAKEAR